MTPEPENPTAHRLSPHRLSLGAIARGFLVLGMTSFGGGAVVSLLQDRIVNRRKWLSNEEFLEATVLSQSLPGPIASNAITYVGYRLHGVAGALFASVFYTIPSFLMMIGFAILYEGTRDIPAADRVFFGLNPATSALIGATAYRLGKTALKTPRRRLQAAVVLALAVLWPKLTLPMILFTAIGGVLAAWSGVPDFAPEVEGAPPTVVPRRALAALGALAAATGLWVLSGSKKIPLGSALPNWTPTSRLPALAWICFKIGAMTFGGGFVIIPLIGHEVVDTMHWLTPKDVTDGAALGMMTPGPFAIAATFIGYRVDGFFGALVATIGIFFVPFWLVIIAAHSLNRFRENPLVQGALAGVTPTGVALLASAAVLVGRNAFVGPAVSLGAVAVLIAVGFFLVVRYNVNPLFVLFGSAAAGWFFAP